MLVPYSDSESDSQDLEAPRAKRRKVQVPPPEPRNTNASPPPPPASFHSLYATNVRAAATDDPSLHGGRTRQIAHVEGNWQTHIYLEWTPSKDQLPRLEKAVKECQASPSHHVTAACTVHSLLRSSLNVLLPLHISLSAPLTLKTEQKDGFAAAVEKAVSTCGATLFSVQPISMQWVSNLDQTRTFLVLKLGRPDNDDLNKLLQACNRCAEAYGLDLLYHSHNGHNVCKKGEKPNESADLSTAFHISLAWTLTKAEDLGQPVVEPGLLGEIQDTIIHFDTLKLKIGSTVADLKLPT